jgi:hypothetical protein
MLHAFAFLQVSVLYICLLFSHASRVIDIARLAQDGTTGYKPIAS